MFDDYTERLRTSLESARGVVGLVVMGTTSDSTHRDQWSDHDFWVITEPGMQDSFVEDLSWLPDYQNIAITIKHGPRGRTILFRNRHKVEFLVFDAGEAQAGKVERYTVLIDRDRIAELLETIHAETLRQARTRSDGLENLCVLAWSACERYMRGEGLSARQYMDGFAVNQFLNLMRDSEADQGYRDVLDPRRRFEQTSPELATEVLAVLNRPVPDAALSLLQIVERELKPKAPTLAWDKVVMVRSWISDLRNVKGR